MDDQTLLDLVDAQIAALLSGGAVKAWSEGGHEVQHMNIMDLYRLKQDLENRIAAAGGALCLPIVEVNV